MESIQSQNSNVTYSINEEPLVISKRTIDLLLKQENPGDIMSLYTFYYYTAKWQKTDQPKASINYVKNALHWGKDKTRAIKKQLIELNLIEEIITKSENNLITGHYIKIKFLWENGNILSQNQSNPRISHPTEIPPGGSIHRVGNKEGNALNPNILNALNPNIYMSTKNKVTKSSKKERNEMYLPLCRYLVEIVQTKKNIKISSAQLNSWSNDFRQLAEIEKVDMLRMREALIWYRDNAYGSYVPVIESGASFREKFLKLESAIERGKDKHKTNNTTNASRVFTRSKINYNSEQDEILKLHNYER